MNIDKASFLLLAGALSAGACVITSSDNDDDGDGGNGTGATGATTSAGGSGGAGGAMGGAGGGTCDDSVGTSADCSLATSSCVEGVALLNAITLCNVADDYFKPGVAQAATECIVALDSAATCPDVLACRNDALANACEADVSIECEALVQGCAGGFAIDLAECEALLPGFSEAGIAAVSTQCGPATEGCLLGGVYADLGECIDNMGPAL
jgi:hypothetical protein